MKRTKTDSPQNKVIGGVVVLIALLVMCRSCVGGEDSEDAGDIAPLGDFPTTVITVDEPTDEPATEAPPEATATDEPIAIPDTEEPPTAEPAPPTVAPEPPPAPTEAPAPPPSGAVSDLSEAPPAGEPWLPCARGQIKGNRDSLIYHPPSGGSYDKTYRNVWCFNSAAEAEGAGYRAARN